MINEIKNQHVHLFWGLISCYFFTLLFGFKFYFVPLIIGVLVELYQYFFKNEGLKLKDRILDVTFWAFSGVIYYYLS